MTILLTSLASCASGIVLGLLGGYIAFYRPLTARIEKLTSDMLAMKKQGFVPQFELRQQQTTDLAKDIVEY